LVVAAEVVVESVGSSQFVVVAVVVGEVVVVI
jgi:hypothetical protein